MIQKGETTLVHVLLFKGVLFESDRKRSIDPWKGLLIYTLDMYVFTNAYMVIGAFALMN